MTSTQGNPENEVLYNWDSIVMRFESSGAANQTINEKAGRTFAWETAKTIPSLSSNRPPITNCWSQVRPDLWGVGSVARLQG